MTAAKEALEALNTLINPHVFLVERQKIELAETIKQALTANTWWDIKDAESKPEVKTDEES